MEEVKKCFKCGSKKKLSEFYKHSQMKDGHLNKCKECTKRDAKASRVARIDYYRAYDRKRGSRQGIEYVRRYRVENIAKYKAHSKVNRAIKSGKLKRGAECEACGDQERLVAHHDDYARPLEIRWLCSACHHQWHAINGEGANGRRTNETELA